jgi:hypothetical protein
MKENKSKELTEQRVREIAREEIKKWQQELNNTPIIREYLSKRTKDYRKGQVKSIDLTPNKSQSSKQSE